MTTSVAEPKDPLDVFAHWHREALRHESLSPDAVAVATASGEGQPSLRMVLLKRFDPDGFAFNTNNESRKALDLRTNPLGAMLFYWPNAGRQVRIEGPIKALPGEVSDSLFASRPRPSQLAAWTSRQSQPLKDRQTLLEEYQRREKEFLGKPVPKPKWWGSFLLVPQRFEFWTHNPNRLHHRLEYFKLDEGWRKRLLSP